MIRMQHKRYIPVETQIIYTIVNDKDIFKLQPTSKRFLFLKFDKSI